MTWIMFDNKILHPESGNGFYRSFNSIHYFQGSGVDVMTTECFLSSEQVEARFEELKQTLIRKPRYVMKDDGSLQNILSEEL